MRDETSYRTIAPYYDWIMAHVDYDAWGRYLGRLWRKFGPDPKSILELGAGTCPFARRDVFPAGAKVCYTDLSPFMLAQASDTDARVRVAANALALPFKSNFKLCLMVYDALNYLVVEEDLSQCFREVFRVLEPGGLFIFDITTESNSRKHFHQAVDFGELEGCTYYRESSYNRDDRMQINDFTFFVETQPDSWRKIKESHQQRIYKVSHVQRLARKAGFEAAACFEGFTFRPGKEESERVHFVMKKPGVMRKPG